MNPPDDQPLLRESEEKYRTLFEASTDAIFLATLDGAIRDANASACRMFGYARKEILSLRAWALAPPEEEAKMTRIVEEELKNSGVWGIQMESAGLRKDGSIFPTEVSLRVMPVGGEPCALVYIRDITEQKRAEAALRQSEERFRLLVQTQGEGIGIMDFEERFVFANPAGEEIFGTSPGGLAGRRLDEFTDPEEYLALREETWKRMYGEKGSYEMTITRADGEKRILQVTAVPWLDKEKNFSGTFGNFQDITEHKRAEEALRKSEENYRALVETTGTGYVIIDSEGRVLDANREYIRLTGHEALEEIRGRRVTEWTAQHDLARNAEEVRQCMERGFVHNLEIDYVNREGKVTPVEMNATVLPMAEETKIVTFCRDITERRRAEEVLRHQVEEIRRAESRWRLAGKVLELLNGPEGAVETIRDILMLVKKETGFEAVGIRLQVGDDFPYYETNGFSEVFVAAERYLCQRNEAGNVVRDLNGNPVLECMCGNILRGRTDPALPFFTEGGSFWSNCTTNLLASTTEKDRQSRTRNRCKGDGYESVALIPLRSRGKTIGLLQLNDRRPDRFTPEMIHFFEGLGASIGIALFRKWAEETLQESEQRFRSLVETTSDWIWEVDQKGFYTYASPKIKDILGYEPEEVIGKTPFDLMPPEEARRVAAEVREVIESQKALVGIENTNRHKDGRLVVLESSGVPVFAGDGQFQGYRGIDRDITERRRLEEQLAQSQKLESLGMLAGGIAHEFNNILGGILGYASLMRLKMEPDHPFRGYVETIEKSSQRAAVLTSQLLGFARKGKYDLRSLNLNLLAEDTLAIVRQTFDRAVTVEARLAESLPNVEGDMMQLQQVLMNLCINARDAMPKGGSLVLTTRTEQVAEGDERVPPESKAGLYALLSVADTGCGMDEETQAKIFEPFFTTKEKGKGTGLGLAMVYGVVKNHGGFVTVRSEVGRGSVFTLHLPAAEKLSDRRPEALAAPERSRGAVPDQTILVVDDEESIRFLARDILVGEGYRVLLAEDGARALEIYREHQGEIGLVVLDIIMPKLGGGEVFLKMKEMDPGVHVLVSSGYSQEGKAQEILSGGAMGFVQKPFHVRDLISKVRQGLDGGGIQNGK